MARLKKAQIAAKMSGEIKNPLKENIEQLLVKIEVAAKMNMLDARLAIENLTALVESDKLDALQLADAVTHKMHAIKQEKYNYEIIINKPNNENISEQLSKQIKKLSINDVFNSASNMVAQNSIGFPKDKEVFGMREFSDKNAFGEGNGYLLRPHAYVDTAVSLSEAELKKKFRRLVSHIGTEKAEKKLTNEYTNNKTVSVNVMNALVKDGSSIGREVLEQNFNRYHALQLEKNKTNKLSDLEASL